MPLTARYCSRCGGTVETRIVDNRSRQVCTGCETVFYRNPLPVAASVVLDRARNVLLVQRAREPHRGLWCLPIGFAELGETIAEAAKRELKEETGLDGRPLRLLDVDSFESDFYGDLLIVTFELERVGGVERPGDDAEDVRYFALDELPPLAFSSNAKALRYCRVAHEDEWAIQDSFRRLQADEGSSMLSDSLVTWVQDRAAEVTRLWHDDVRSNPSTASYGRIDSESLFDRGFTAVSQFGRWLTGYEADDEVRAFYRELGRERRAQGFALHEVVSSLTLLKKHVWNLAGREGVWQRPKEMYQLLELNRRIAAFFDRAVYYTTRGYEAP